MIQRRKIANTPPPAKFNFVVIDDTNYLRNSYKLRYQVYCEEKSFLPLQHYQDRQEIDAYDQHAIHVGAINSQDDLVGTIRLVLPCSLGFPLFKHCEFFQEYQLLADPNHPQRLATAEISRLAVSSSYRRRSGDGLYGLAYEDERQTLEIQGEIYEPRRCRPEIILGLYKVMYQESKRRGIAHWLAAMESTLLRLLRCFKFAFQPIGPEVDYYGPVTPHLAEIAEIEHAV